MFYKPHPEKRMFCALDESNHGRDEEIFVFSFSEHEERSRLFLTDLSSKGRRSETKKRFSSLMRFIDYRFCVVSRDHYAHFGQHNIPLKVVSAFLHDLQFKDLDSLDIWIDGDLTSEQRGKIKKIVKSFLGIPYSLVGVHSLPKRKDCEGRIKTNDLLSLADYQANFLFQQPRYETSDKQGKYYDKRISFP